MSRNRSPILHTCAILVAFVVALSSSSDAAATIIRGIEFLNWETIDVDEAIDLQLDTTEDLFVFIPNGLLADQLTLEADEVLFLEDGIVVEPNDPVICSTGCDSLTLNRSGDIVLRIFSPLGDVNFKARNIVVSSSPIPEPGSLTLLTLGLVAFAARRSHQRNLRRLRY